MIDFNATEYALRAWARDFAPDLADALFEGETGLTWEQLTDAFLDSYAHFMTK